MRAAILLLPLLCGCGAAFRTAPPRYVCAQLTPSESAWMMWSNLMTGVAYMAIPASIVAIWRAGVSRVWWSELFGSRGILAACGAGLFSLFVFLCGLHHFAYAYGVYKPAPYVLTTWLIDAPMMLVSGVTALAFPFIAWLTVSRLSTTFRKGRHVASALTLAVATAEKDANELRAIVESEDIELVGARFQEMLTKQVGVSSKRVKELKESSPLHDTPQGKATETGNEQ